MKKILFSIATLAVAFGFTACDNEDEVLSNVKDGKTSVLAMTEVGSRTALADDGEGAYNVVWSEGDQITIGDQTFTLENGAGSTTASFTGTAPADGEYTAYYATTDGTVPTSQTYTAGEISNFPMTATATVTDGEMAPLKFKNVGGLLQLTVKGTEKISSIEVSAAELTTPITLDCGTGVTLSADGTVFYIAMPEQTYTDVEIEISDAKDKYCTKKFKGASGMKIERSKISKAAFTASDFKYRDYLCFTAEEDNAVITLKKKGTPRSCSFQYSTDRETWLDYDMGTELKLVNTGDKIYFRGNNPEGIAKTSSSCVQFAITSKIAASGNIMSMIDPKCKATTIPSNYGFITLFYKCSGLTSAPELPATTLKNYCYNKMFQDCTNLITAPTVLPAETLTSNCYASMFNGCGNLETAPEIMATSLTASGACNSMFYKCPKLKYVKLHFNSIEDFDAIGLFINNEGGTVWVPTGTTYAQEICSGWEIKYY